MARKTTLFAMLDVFPIITQDPNTGEESQGKQLVFTDVEAGETIIYPMVPELVADLKKKLTMSNQALKHHHEEEARRAQARAMLAGGNGGAPAPGEQAAVENILKGVHRKEEG